ncbi:MAG: hypothetical protein AAF170_06580 [Bacteroidota bacterium]
MISETALLEALRDRHARVHVIVSPPRCGSTAFARVFWEHPTVRYYCHEPFEVTYYQNEGLEAVAEKLAAALDLAALGAEVFPESDSLVLKEMPYQVGDRFSLLARMATPPILFLIRDPRLNIASRIAKKEEVGDSPVFPLIETGWTRIAEQVAYCRDHSIPYHIVEANNFRNTPLRLLPQVFEAFGLSFTPEMIAWDPYPDHYLDNLEGTHTHLYRRVLTSSGLQPATEPVPALETFPKAHGLRAHVAACMEVYEGLRRDPNRLHPAAMTSP